MVNGSTKSLFCRKEDFAPTVCRYKWMFRQQWETKRPSKVSLRLYPYGMEKQPHRIPISCGYIVAITADMVMSIKSLSSVETEEETGTGDKGVGDTSGKEG